MSNELIDGLDAPFWLNISLNVVPVLTGSTLPDWISNLTGAEYAMSSLGTHEGTLSTVQSLLRSDSVHKVDPKEV